MLLWGVMMWTSVAMGCGSVGELQRGVGGVDECCNGVLRCG